MNFNTTFKGKKVVITGHTGFKGSWLSIWLLSLGAEVHGISLPPSTSPSLFVESLSESKIYDNRFNIHDHNKVKTLLEEINPDFLFHLAAQPIVRKSYLDPIETWHTNVLGTVNILNALRLINSRCISIIITSDKCYDNKEWTWGYRESDKLGGADPYSASKGSAELAFNSFYRSYFALPDNNNLVASARAGNVIGGGDWAESRIVPDCIRSWTKNRKVLLRAPQSTRPWQHVLEPLSGYLCLAQELNNNNTYTGESFNFGPTDSENKSVLDVVQELSKAWPDSSWEIEASTEKSVHESGLLKLNCDKAFAYLNWKPTMNFKETIELTKSWYEKFYYESNKINSFELCLNQIKYYTSLAKERGAQWI